MASNMASTVAVSSSLNELLAQAIPEGVKLHSYHISTPPSRCTSLFAPPPSFTSSPSSSATKTKPQKTYCESHSLLVTLSDPTQPPAQLVSDPTEPPAQVAFFAIEVQIFTTATLTTVFISKADSTGYLSLLPNPPPRSSSILRSVASTFVSWIIRHRHRADRPLVLSLFARAQNQYLFPGSSDNGKKHVLDDRALVKWWCKTLDPVLREYEPTAPCLGPLKEPDNALPEATSVRSKAHLIVPGHDKYETEAFFPPAARSDPSSAKRWVNAHPLHQIAPYPNAPPRCLVPHFPDDPKTRFLVELDDEIANASVPTNLPPSSLKHQSPKKRGTGQWRSVKTLDQFWEMMAFRQECCAGRLVGFIWLLFTHVSPPQDPADINRTERLPLSSLQPSSPSPSPTPSSSSSPSPSPSPSPSTSNQKPETVAPKPKVLKHPASATPAKRTKRTTFLSKKRPHKTVRFGNRKKKRTGPILPRVPLVKSQSNRPNKSKTRNPAPTTTKHYKSPPYTRGNLILTQKEYDRMHELFLRLDFSNIEATKSSTRRWLLETSIVGYPNEVADQEPRSRGDIEWGTTIIGKRKLDTASHADAPTTGQSNGVAMLTVKRKRKQPDNEDTATDTAHTNGSDVVTCSAMQTTTPGQALEPNILSAALVRKKPKLDNSESSAPCVPAENTGMTVLAAGLVRKKPKP